MKKDDLIKVVLNGQKEMISCNAKITAALEGLTDTISNLNDNNVLHTQAIQELRNTLSTSNKVFNFVLVALVMAVIILAGAKAVFDYLKIIP